MAPSWRAGRALFLLLAISRETLAASFYGESYVKFNIAESSSQTTLQFRFFTSRPNGLLFLAAGKESYLFVELHSGNVQVTINFGAGKRVLHSQWSSQLNDLSWHLVEVHHENDNVTLVIDRYYQASTKMPGVLFGLNTQHGIYVGGSGSLNVPYLDDAQTNFRGCIEDVFFNKHGILTSLQPFLRFKNMHEVSLGCSNEFLAGDDEPISLFSSKSYVAFPLWNVQEEEVFECTLQTSSAKGLLLYSSGQAGDFVAMEIENGFVKSHIAKSKSRIQLSSLSPVNDNHWRSVKLKLSAKYIELTIDKQTVTKSLPLYSKLPILKRPLYIGGVDDAIRAEVQTLGLASVSGRYAQGGSFRGCLRDLKINSERKSLKNVLVTKDISVGCRTKSNGMAGPTVVPVGTSAPFADIGTGASRRHRKESHGQFVVLRNLIVPEGGQAALESKHIKVNVEFKKLGIRQSQILFKIKQQPSHGHLRLDIEPEQEESMFTMLDLWQGRLIYIHDGSEENYDYFTFSVLTSSKKEMPEYLQGNKDYMFTITVRPINDAPELTLPNGNVFPLVEHSKKCLNVDSINIFDSDTNSADLSVMVLGNLNADAGFLENSKTPGVAITTFPYEDLKNGHIFFVHSGVKNARIVLRASDGEKVSNTVVLRVMAVPLEYKLTNHTGISVLQGSMALITLSHLAVETNSFQQELEIQYEITEQPRYGEIQRHAGGEWKKTNTFTQRSIERNRVRYICTFREMQQDNVPEHFKFTVNIGNNVSEEFLFPIMVKWLTYNLLQNVSLVINKAKREYLSSDHLLALISEVKIPENEVLYKLVSLPERGNILLNNVSLQINSSFSQQNISDYKVEYQIINWPQKEMHDSFRFKVFTKYVISNPYNFKINIKADPRSIHLTNNGLSVTEGEGKLITESELFAQTLDNKTFQYKVIKRPRHGKLTLINFSDSLESNNNISSFTNQDILGKRLMYIHDDSETQYDEIDITASAIEDGEWISSDREAKAPLIAEIKFNISVQLKNDEKPVRVVDKVFHVIRNGKRLLTLTDLCYDDPDTDFDDQQLLYTRRGIPNGDLVLANETSHRLYQFKQEDLAEKRVLFMHHGPDYGRFVLFITDGKHYTSSLLEVSASDPYINQVSNTGLLIQKGREGVITVANLSVTTNQDIRSDHEITFEMSLLPKHGQIFVNNLALGIFSQYHLRMGQVTYRHDDSNNLVDTFNFTVYAKGIQLNAGMNVRIYLENHQRPPEIVQKNSLLVEEGKPVKISKEKLLVVHENSLPSEIEFTVRSPPIYGYIRKFTSEEGYLGAEENPVLTFTQQDIIDGNIQYVQTLPGQLQDLVSLDVTNGIRAVSGIDIAVDIVPKLIPLDVQNFTVIEGNSKVLEEEFLNISSRHFAGLNCDFVLIDPPKHGRIAKSRFPGVALTKFTRKQVEQGLIVYIHDDSEQLLDNFTIMANSMELWKQSLPRTIFVTVSPVNDEAPVIRRNKILRVWVGSVTEITVNELSAEDKDSFPAQLCYSVSPPNNGHLALKSSPNKSILNFTQAHIEEGQLVFVHNGAMSGGFNFQVTDGLNFAPRQIFSITARNLVIILENNNGLEIFPGSRKPITSSHLKAITNDVTEAQNRTIMFLVASSPKLGKLIRIFADNSSHAVSSFTQSMVDEGVIFYEHTDKEAVGWNAQDNFTFTVSSPPAALSPQVFRINISYEIKGHDRSSLLLANRGAVVQEGGKVLIDKANLDGSNLLSKLPEVKRSMYEVWYQVISLPQHGRIVVGERNLTEEKPNFSQYIINKFGITYVHDDSESLTDQFTFDVWLNQKSKSAIKPDSDVLEETFNITVLPVNDQPPELKTKMLHLNVLQGDTALLGPENLKTEDLDNTPEEIKYTIISNPANGHLALWTQFNESIKDFTQADINDGRVWFVQDGSSSSGVFYFSVSDGKHSPLYQLFNVEVTPMSVNLVNLTEVVLLQGQSTILITNIQLSAATNGKNSEIGFQITQPLQYGHLLIDNKQVSRFRQADLYAGKLSYCMTDLTSSRDVLEFMVFTPNRNLTEQVLNIIVQPLVEIAPHLNISNWIAYTLKAGDLDATQLAKLTNSNPVFEVTVPPSYGRVVKKSSNSSNSEELSVFTQKDIDNGVVFLAAEANMTGVDVLNDSFTFVLKADNVQPAVGHFRYVITPHEPPLVQTVTPEVPLFTSENILKSYSLTQSQAVLFLKSVVHTEVPEQAARTRLPSGNRWGHLNNKDTSLNEEDARRRPWTEATIKTSSESTWVHPQDNSNRLFIIIPLISVVVLFTATTIFVCVYLICHKPKKAKSLIEDQPPTAPKSPAFCPEKSLAVPTVTVTPLLKSTGTATAIPFMATRREHLYPGEAAPTVRYPLQSNWFRLDPEMIQHCRKTNPTLKHNQYWV